MRFPAVIDSSCHYHDINLGSNHRLVAPGIMSIIEIMERLVLSGYALNFKRCQ